MEPGGRRRPGLYADIPVPVLQVPAGEEGGTGCLLNLLKEVEKKEEDEEEKKENDEEEDEMGGRGGMRRICRTAWWWRRACLCNSPWSLLPLVSFPCSSCFKVLFSKKKLNNHIVEINTKSKL